MRANIQPYISAHVPLRSFSLVLATEFLSPSGRKFQEGDFSLLRTRPNERRLRQSGNLNQQAPSPSHRRARRLEGDKAPSTKVEGVGVGRRWGTRNPKKLEAGGL